MGGPWIAHQKLPFMTCNGDRQQAGGNLRCGAANTPNAAQDHDFYLFRTNQINKVKVLGKRHDTCSATTVTVTGNRRRLAVCRRSLVQHQAKLTHKVLILVPVLEDGGASASAGGRSN